MPSPFGGTLDIKLIKLVESNPILYNNKLEGYLELCRRELIWQRIGKELEMPAPLCKNRWVTIRDNFRRRIKLREQTPRSTRAKKNKYCKYKYEDHMGFLMPFYQQEDGYRFHQQDDEETNDGTAEDYVDGDRSYDEEEVFIDLNESKPDAASLFNITNKGHEGGMSGKTDKCFVSTSSPAADRADPINVYLDAVASTLRNLNQYYLNQAKTKIFQVAQDCELQQILNKGKHPPAV